MSWSRGLLRLWMVLSILWAGGVIGAAILGHRQRFGMFWDLVPPSPSSVARAAAVAASLPLLSLTVFLALRWIARGFRPGTPFVERNEERKLALRAVEQATAMKPMRIGRPTKSVLMHVGYQVHFRNAQRVGLFEKLFQSIEAAKAYSNDISNEELEWVGEEELIDRPGYLPSQIDGCIAWGRDPWFWRHDRLLIHSAVKDFALFKREYLEYCTETRFQDFFIISADSYVDQKVPGAKFVAGSFFVYPVDPSDPSRGWKIDTQGRHAGVEGSFWFERFSTFEEARNQAIQRFETGETDGEAALSKRNNRVRRAAIGLFLAAISLWFFAQIISR